MWHLAILMKRYTLQMSWMSGIVVSGAVSRLQQRGCLEAMEHGVSWLRTPIETRWPWREQQAEGMVYDPYANSAPTKDTRYLPRLKRLPEL